MKIIFVSGGSYKSFYLNYYLKLKRCDLLVFNFGVIYDYNLAFEDGTSALVKPELMALANRLHSIVLAGVNVINGGTKKRCILMCDGKTIKIKDAKIGLYAKIKNKSFVFGDEKCKGQAMNKIILSNKRIYPVVSHCSLRKVYVFCDRFGLVFVQNGKLQRKFYKYSKIILK